jgi:hypothetical protein
MNGCKRQEELLVAQLVSKFPTLYGCSYSYGPSLNSVLRLTNSNINIQLNIILPSTPRSPKYSLSLRYSKQNFVRIMLFPMRSACTTRLTPLHLITAVCGEEFKLSRSSSFSSMNGRTHWHMHGRNTTNDRKILEEENALFMGNYVKFPFMPAPSSSDGPSTRMCHWMT